MALDETETKSAGDAKRRWQARHPERARELKRIQNKKYYDSNPDKRREHSRRYNENRQRRIETDPEFAKKFSAAKKIRDRRARIRARGITKEKYDEMVSDQKGLCAICEQPPKDGVLRIDHNHQTGKVRALLCHGCNAGIGLFKEDTTRLENARQYLWRFKWL